MAQRKSLAQKSLGFLPRMALGMTAKQTYLGAFTPRPTGNASLLAVDLMDGQVGVSWALLALVRFLLDVVARGAGHAR